MNGERAVICAVAPRAPRLWLAAGQESAGRDKPPPSRFGGSTGESFSVFLSMAFPCACKPAFACVDVIIQDRFEEEMVIVGQSAKL